MTILAITPYTGSEKLVRMTEAMLTQFNQCTRCLEDQVDVVAVNNAASRPQKFPVTWHCHSEENLGFGNAINLAIQREIIEPPKLKSVNIKTGVVKSAAFDSGVTDVLILNNDLQFPEIHWLRELLSARDGKHVLSPCTDVTATKAAVNDRSFDIDPRPHHEVSAFCWLVPVALIFKLRKKFGFNLFSPEFSNYGSDDITAACLRSIVGPKPFRIVPRSFVKHLKAQTANELGVKAGTPELLRRITNWKRARRLA